LFSPSSTTPFRPISRSVTPSRRIVRREDAERFIAEVRGDDPDLASYLRIEEREVEAAAKYLISRSSHANATVDTCPSPMEGCARRA